MNECLNFRWVTILILIQYIFFKCIDKNPRSTFTKQIFDDKNEYISQNDRIDIKKKINSLYNTLNNINKSNNYKLEDCYFINEYTLHINTNDIIDIFAYYNKFLSNKHTTDTQINYFLRAVYGS